MTPATGDLAALDLFADPVLTDPHPVHRALRDLGPAVYLPRHDVWAVGRHSAVHTVLRDPVTYRSVNGVALTETVNRVILGGTVLAADDDDHRRLRRVLADQLKPTAVRELTDGVHRRADRLVAELAGRGTFDAVGELAGRLVVDVVLELMGVAADTADELIAGAAATFDMFGPDNRRYQEAGPAAAAMTAFLTERISRASVRPDSWLGAVYAAVDDGRMTEDEVAPLMSAYTVAGMDTTIHCISTAVHLLATHPEQWRLLRGRRATPRGAFHETLRYDAPLQGLGRRVVADATLEGVRIPAGQQVWLLYGSAGRDERRWPDAGRYDVGRPDAADHLALGAGPHSCAGNHLAELEVTAVLRALAARCTGLELAGEPTRALNNTLRGWAAVPVTVTPDRRRLRPPGGGG